MFQQNQPIKLLFKYNGFFKSTWITTMAFWTLFIAVFKLFIIYYFMISFFNIKGALKEFFVQRLYIS